MHGYGISQRLAVLSRDSFRLNPDPRRSRVGFVHSSKLADDERYVLPDD